VAPATKFNRRRALPTVYRADNAGATITLPSKTSAIGALTTTDVVRDEHFQRRSTFDSSEYGFSLTTGEQARLEPFGDSRWCVYDIEFFEDMFHVVVRDFDN
jgi:hypothetical protein